MGLVGLVPLCHRVFVGISWEQKFFVGISLVQFIFLVADFMVLSWLHEKV